jgi:glycosyltransferase involved in cell wall biosynthesis
MKILLANKFYYLKGGTERHFFDLKKLLEQKGHKVISFAMQDDKNFGSPYTKYFVSPINLEKSSFSLEGLKAAGRIIYSLEAKANMEKLIKEEKPDIAHLHNIYHQISPSILTPLKKAGIPVVITVHDFKLMCPNYIFYTEGKVCERCKKYKFYNCVLHKCVKNSYLASKVNMLEMYYHNFLKIYKNNIDLYLCPSQFVKDKLVEFGFNKDKIEVLPHFIAQLETNSFSLNNNEQHFSSDNYILYFGRLSKEKGIKTLLEAIDKIKNKDIKLKLAGTGPKEEELKEYVKKKGLQEKIEFLGFLDGKRLSDTISRSLFSVIPSVFYETFGLSLLESYNYNKSAIAANIGALPELIKEGETGLLFESGNSDDLAEKIDNMLRNREKMENMGKSGKEFIKKFNQEDYYKKLEEIYKKLI